MEEKDTKLRDKFDEFVRGYEHQKFISSKWPIDNGVYRQYSALDPSEVAVSGTSFCL